MRFARIVLVASLACGVAGAAATVSRAFADDGEPAAPAAVPADLIEYSDRKKQLSVKLPRTWKALTADETDPNALAGWTGLFGAEPGSPNGFCFLYTMPQFARAVLARAVSLPQVGAAREGTSRQGAGWAEGCVTTQEGRAVEWRRFVEKGGRVYFARFLAGAPSFEAVRGQVEKILDTFAVTGDVAAPTMGGGPAKKVGEFDVQTDADAERAKSLEKAANLMAAGREVLVKLLPKPVDTSRPAAWLYQNGQKFEDRAKAALGTPPEFAAFNPIDRCAMVKLLQESRDQYPGELAKTGAAQYVWQYFGGEVPVWIGTGLTFYGQFFGEAGGKGKLPSERLGKVKSAIASGKRRLDQWFDVGSWNEVTDNDQGINELFAWQVYFRTGRGAQKYKKQFTAYVASLRDSGDPAVARKAFDGVNFDEMLQDFKAWGADWK